MRARIGVIAVVGWSLACGGGGGGGEGAGAASAAASQFGSPAFQAYKYNRTTIKFNTDTKATTWWANMSCDKVEGTWVQDGDEITITWNDKQDCMTWDEAKLKQLSECSMAQYWMRDPKTGDVKDDDSWMYERSEPKCPE